MRQHSDPSRAAEETLPQCSFRLWLLLLSRVVLTFGRACLRAAFPAAGAYANEADYFEPDWSNSFWGANCPPPLGLVIAVSSEMSIADSAVV